MTQANHATLSLARGTSNLDLARRDNVLNPTVPVFLAFPRISGKINPGTKFSLTVSGIGKVWAQGDLPGADPAVLAMLDRAGHAPRDYGHGTPPHPAHLIVNNSHRLSQPLLVCRVIRHNRIPATVVQDTSGTMNTVEPPRYELIIFALDRCAVVGRGRRCRGPGVTRRAPGQARLYPNRQSNQHPSASGSQAACIFPRSDPPNRFLPGKATQLCSACHGGWPTSF
jgi:hypothetical protein